MGGQKKVGRSGYNVPNGEGVVEGVGKGTKLGVREEESVCGR